MAERFPTQEERIQPFVKLHAGKEKAEEGKTLHEERRAFSRRLEQLFRIFNAAQEKENPDPNYPVPTLGIEAETFAHLYSKGLPKKVIRDAEKAGIPRDKKDSFYDPEFSGSTWLPPDAWKRIANKWEAAFDPVAGKGGYTLLMRELQALREKGLFPTGPRRWWGVEHQPVHVRLGKVISDFPNHVESPEAERNKDRFSDCFIFARMLDATLYSTSPERLAAPFTEEGRDWSDYDTLDPLRSYAQKGNSGVYAKTASSTKGDLDSIELRTPELWGEYALQGFARYLKSAQCLGTMLIAYQKLAWGRRKEIIALEKEGKYSEAKQLVKDFQPTDEISKARGITFNERDRLLALEWLDTRRKVRETFEEYGLSDPSRQYWHDEFLHFAKVLKQEDDKRRGKAKKGWFRRKEPATKDNFVSNMRTLVAAKRACVEEIMESQ
jgi:hypothetical protein